MALSDEARAELDHFVTSANWAMLHPLDWGRFYQFIIGCHQRGEDLEQPSDIAHVMRGAGAPQPEVVSDGGVVDPLELGSLYYRGIELLRAYDEA